MSVTPKVPRDNLIQVPTVSGQGHHINVIIRELGDSVAQLPCVVSSVKRDKRIPAHSNGAVCLA
jgi:hypothetical protein